MQRSEMLLNRKLYLVMKIYPPKENLNSSQILIMIIEIPEPKEEEDEDFLKDLIDMKIETGEYLRWREILEGFIYEKIVEISKVDIDAVTARTLFGDDFVAILSEANHSISQKLSKELTKEKMIDTLKNNIRNISSALLAEEGIGSYELGYFYGVLLDHVKIKLMNNFKHWNGNGRGFNACYSSSTYYISKFSKISWLNNQYC